MISFGVPQGAGAAALLVPEWPAPSRVRALMTTRAGGVSGGVFASLNLGTHVGDHPAHVAENRGRLQQGVDKPLAYLNQVHGTKVVQAASALQALQQGTPLEADASVNTDGSAACVVMTADCLPVLLCDTEGRVVAAAHAGWRGLAGGVLENTVAAMRTDPGRLMAWFGAAIGAEAFEVGAEVRAAFVAQHPDAAQAFTDIGEDKFLADIYALARLRLNACGVTAIYGGTHCTVLERERFFSYRRDGQTGRMAAAVWLV